MNSASPTLFRLNASHEAAVIELGMNHPRWKSAGYLKSAGRIWGLSPISARPILRVWVILKM
ncbi:MAG: hypothetical protein R2860_06940 [Desulfobacterales bacterium]